MTSPDGMQSGSMASGYKKASQTQQVTFETPFPGVGMTEEHYARVQNRIRREVRGTHTSSIWFALALTTLALGASLVVTVMSATLTASTRGKLEVAAWALAVITVIFVVVHCVMLRDTRKRADDVIDEMDAYCYRTPFNE